MWAASHQVGCDVEECEMDKLVRWKQNSIAFLHHCSNELFYQNFQDSKGRKTGERRKYYLYVCNYCPM